MNNFFSLNRFYKYTRYDFIYHWKSYLFWTIGLFLFFTLIVFPFLSFTDSNSFQIYGRIEQFYLFAGTALIGFSFQEFNKKENVITNLLLPVSAFEKLLHFLVFKYLLFLLFFPFLYYLLVTNYIYFGKVLTKLFGISVAERTFEIQTMGNYITNYVFKKDQDTLISNNVYGLKFNLPFILVLLSLLIPFKVRARKYNFFRWLLSLFVSFTLIIGITKFIDPPILVLARNIESLHVIFMPSIIILTWIYSYYLLKEKEVNNGI